jgi:hypothetical protein
MKLKMKAINLAWGMLAQTLYIIYPDIHGEFGLGYYEFDEYREMIRKL